MAMHTGEPESGEILLEGLDFHANFEALMSFEADPREFTGLYTALISLLSSNRYPEQAVSLLNSFHARGGMYIRMYVRIEHCIDFNYAYI